MANKETSTIKVELDDGLIVHATQDYSETLEGGHVRYAIFDKDGHIVAAGSSGGAPPDGDLRHASVEEFFPLKHVINAIRKGSF